ncbi:iron-containing alcohol dehydrogenase [Kluyvera sp. SCKS090646]|uniref:Iron-containing alcohol dehydrogenase n=1 Tax=Kluyvera sichuanensis TaxID=2725494 RepID=A0ABR6RRZ3_9ENTR|nr:hypothetical protein [Kluyvera sichuanensis]MBC1185897.1 iron-containing alcohol dehydrogenase [Kluyvera sichuanensis]
MRTIATCMKCFQELGHPSNEIVYLPYYEDRIAIHSCSHGHKNALVLQSQKFEVLLESGAEALLKGFTLEACATFYAALERTYEFAIQVYVVSRDIDGEAFVSMFKEIARQSERQIGVFMALYLLDTGKAYKLDPSLSEFRNKVIHKGEIPTPEAAHEFCSKIYGRISELIDVLKVAHSESIQSIVINDMLKRQSKLDANTTVASSSGTLFFSLSNSLINRDFDSNLQSFKTTIEKMFGDEI